VAKILVADDNSNVQKTVTLALADLGVEVIAVNNGDAAVRKLADIIPDLVLADIFMPVRNGYEVCEYVKKDSRFSHVPVVLLVGAFDPLDEREAQRVGADGILKKPFVPPDPLIMMVKTLLDRTLGDRLVAVGTEKPAVSMNSTAGGKSGGVAIVEAPRAPRPRDVTEELPVQEFHPPVDRVSFGEGERPIAFGQLLDIPEQESKASGTGVVEPVDDEQILTSSRDASLGDPIFWKTEEPEPQSEEGNSEAEGELSSDLPMRAWKPDEEAHAHQPDADILQPVDTFELVRDQKDEETGQTSTLVEPSASIIQDPAAQASLTVESAKPEDLAANPIEWMASIPPPPADETLEAAADWSAAVTEVTDQRDEHETVTLKSAAESAAPESAPAPIGAVSTSAPALSSAPPPAATPASAHASIDAQIPDPLKTQPSLTPLAQDVEDTAHSIPKHDWEDMAASLPLRAIEAAVEKPKPAAAPIASAPTVPAASAPSESASTNSAPLVSKPSNQSAEDSARSIPKQDWADMAASLQPKASKPVAEKTLVATVPVEQPIPAPVATAEREVNPVAPMAGAEIASTSQATAANSALSATPDPALVEAIVQRILDKMRPQVVEIITKEFLRPIVQALVHREIEKH
jgi:CheY-like chemotaxis protein